MNESIYKAYLKIIAPDGIPSFLEKYLQVPCLIRLKKICYFCGMDYASIHVYDFKEYVTRFDHSLTVALLTWKYTKDKTATIAALFHDVATPCFSHVIDYMNKDYATQESTEEFTEEILRSDKTLEEYLQSDGIEIENIIDFKRYSIVDNSRPKLCADRINGIILTGMSWTRDIEIEDIKGIIEDLEVCKNEHGELELGFKTETIAHKVLSFSDRIDAFCHSNEDNFMMELLASITRLAIELNLVTYKELFYINEEELMQRIRACKNKTLQELLDTFEHIKWEDIPETEMENVKPRDLNPLVRMKRIKDVFPK